MKRNNCIKSIAIRLITCIIISSFYLQGCGVIKEAAKTPLVYQRPKPGIYTKIVTTKIKEGWCSADNPCGFYKRKGDEAEVCISLNCMEHPQEIAYEEYGLHGYRHAVGLPPVESHKKGVGK